MKNYLTILLLVWAQLVFGQAEPITSLKGQAGTKFTSPKLVVPNLQATKTSAGGMIETGNDNLLENPEFEHSTASQGWACSLGTPTAETTTKFGAQSLKVNSAGAGTRCYQYITTNASNLKGTQGVARIMVNTNDSVFQVCALVDGTTSAQDTNCKTVNVTTTNNPWVAVEIPFIMGGTGNGIVVKSATTTSTSSYIDKAFMGPAPYLTTGINGAQLWGTVVISGCSSPWFTTSTSFASFSTQTGCTYTTSGQAQAPSTNIPAIKFASLPAGDYRLEYEGMMYQTTNGMDYQAQFYDGTNTAREISSGGDTTSSSPSISQSISYSTTQSNVTLQIRGKTLTTGQFNLYGTATVPATIKVWYFPPVSKIYSQASLDYDWTAFTPTSPNSSFTFTSSECFHKREGSDLLIQCKFVVNTAAATEARIALPNSLVADPTKNPSIKIVGYGITYSSGTGTVNPLIEPSVSYLTFGSTYPGTYAGGSKQLANQTFTAGVTSSFFARIPIQGWSDYGTITGSFAGIEKCASDLECTDTVSASYLSTGVVDKQSLPGVFGNCTASSGDFTNCSFAGAGFTQIPNCVATLSGVAAGNNAIIRMEAITTTTFQIYTRNSSFASAGYPFTVYCTKTGVDYKPKTAKVATSVGVPTVPGITTTGTGNAIDTFSFTYGTTNATTPCSASPCSYLDQIGTIVSSVTRTALGSYTANFSRTYTKLKCTTGLTTGNAGNGLYTVVPTCSSSCNSVSWNTAYPSVFADSSGTVMCQGSY